MIKRDCQLIQVVRWAHTEDILDRLIHAVVHVATVKTDVRTEKRLRLSTIARARRPSRGNIQNARIMREVMFHNSVTLPAGPLRTCDWSGKKENCDMQCKDQHKKASEQTIEFQF